MIDQVNNTFDPDAFMQQTVDANATEFRVVPEGEYQAMTGDVTSANLEQVNFTYKRGPNEGQPGTMTKLRVPFSIQDQNLEAEFGRKPTVSMQCILDLKDGGLDTGPDKNVQLGRLRQALGQNSPGWSFPQLGNSGPVMIRVKHRKDERDPTRVYAEVVSVAPVR